MNCNRNNDTLILSLTNDYNNLYAKLKLETQDTSFGTSFQFELIEKTGIAFDYEKIIATALQLMEYLKK